MGLTRRIRSSLFLKILLIFSLALVLMILFIAGAHRLLFKPPMRFESILNHSVTYAQLVARDLGNPPALERAQDLARHLHLQIRYESKGNAWSTHEGMEALARHELVSLKGMGGATAGFTPYGLCARIPVERGNLLFLLRPWKKGFHHRVNQLILSVSVLAVLLIVGIWFLIQALLRPIRTLREGIVKLGSGQMDFRMHSTRQDELGELIRSFNRMSDRIREMIRSRDRLLLDVSHEMRSPLTRIKLALEFLEPGEPRQAILEDVEDVERMITAILESERLENPHGSLQLTSVSLREVVTEVGTALEGRPPGIQWQGVSRDLMVRADVERLRILLRNILDNALRHSSNSTQPVEVSAENQKNGITLLIRDYGCGMAPEELSHIFEPFYRADRSRSKQTGGYGLGMNMCWKIMHAHGGSIHVDSRPGRGTTVTLEFPA
ncbi:MAG TPA: HAMP domain-containing histidine kinase [Candidatus Aminicenantes bacterium]|nr:HAMP domain-containing histidine kinase [Candidatus Aminicenantes bacterium]